MNLKVSAPSKVILFGEHSVVYGKLALAASVNLRTVLEIRPSENLCLELEFESLGVSKKWEVGKLKPIWEANKSLFKDYTAPAPATDEALKFMLSKIQAIGSDDPDTKDLALVAFTFLYNVLVGEPHPFVFTVKSEAPVGAGLGSSASYSVVLAAGLWALGCNLRGNGKTSDSEISHDELENISQWALMCEKMFHGSPSGIDNSICTFGGVVSFKQGSFQHVKVPAGKLRVLLVNSKVSRRTSDQVVKGRQRRDHLPVVMEHVYTSMHCIAEEALAIIEKLDVEYDVEKLAELVEVNHHLLSAVGAGHSTLDQIVTIAAKHGTKAKLTGAGGGGFAYVLLPPSLPNETVVNLSKELYDSGYESWETEVGVPGVCFDFGNK